MSRHQQKIIERYYEHKDTINANKLAELVSDLYLTGPSTAANRLWDRAAKTLAAAGVEPARINEVVRKRDVEALARLTQELTMAGGKKKPDAAPAAPAPSTPAASPTSDPTSPETLKAALKAFRKRLKLNRLDEESKLGRSPLSGGKASRIVAIQPPRDYPQATWDELVKQKKLKPAGRGFYELA